MNILEASFRYCLTLKIGNISSAGNTKDRIPMNLTMKAMVQHVDDLQVIFDDDL